MRRIIPLLVLLFATVFGILPAAADTLQFDPGVCAQFTDGGTLSDACLQMIDTYPTPPDIAADRAGSLHARHLQLLARGSRPDLDLRRARWQHHRRNPAGLQLRARD